MYAARRTKQTPPQGNLLRGRFYLIIQFPKRIFYYF